MEVPTHDPPTGGGDVYAGTTGGEAIVEGDLTEPGDTPGPTPPQDHQEPASGPPKPSVAQQQAAYEEMLLCEPTIVADPSMCRVQQRTTADANSSPATPVITIREVLRFKPAGALVTSEPDNLGIAGLPTNYMAGAAPQEATGSIFDLPVSVRFTPVAFDFHTGDGTVVTSVTGGSTWEQLGLPQFSPTATSHTYRERGTFDVHVEVHYSAEVDLGTGWIPLTGTVTSVGATQQIRIFEAHTALVAHTCLETPTAPGC